VSSDTLPAPHAFPSRARAGLVLAALAALSAAGCGKKGPPLPPLRILPRPAQGLHVRQVGAEVVLDATLAPSRTDDTPLGPEARVQILRMSPSPTLRPSAVSARYLMVVFQRQASVVASVEVAGHIVYHDRTASGLPAAAGAPAAGPPRYLYALLVEDGHGQKSPLSAVQEIQMSPPPAAPLHLKVEPAEGEVRLAWESAAPDAKGEMFNVYRRPAAQQEEPLAPLNPAPLAERSYVDTRFTYGATYFYSVRALVAPPPPLRESVPCDEIEARPLDVYPPKAPTGLAAAVEGQAIKLYWFPNSEPDLHSYRVYRREAKGEYRPIGDVEAAETSFADTGAARGVRYYYELTALDGATPPNESARSAEVSESVSGDTASPPGGPGR
jgi:hypothetical protein